MTDSFSDMFKDAAFNNTMPKNIGYMNTEDGKSVLDIAFSQTHQAQQGTILSKIAPKLNTSISTTPIANNTIHTTKSVTHSNVHTQKIALGGLKQNIAMVKQSSAIAIESAKREVIATMKNLGPKYGDLFMDRSLGGTSIGVIANAALGGASPTAFLDLLYLEKGTPKKPRNEMIAEVLDQLREQSAPATSHPDSGIGYMSAITPVEPNIATFNWTDINEEELTALMVCDPNNPNEKFFPELRNLNTLDHAIDSELDNLNKVTQNLPTPAYMDTSLQENLRMRSLEVSGFELKTALVTDLKLSETLDPDKTLMPERTSPLEIKSQITNTLP